MIFFLLLLLGIFFITAGIHELSFKKRIYPYSQLKADIKLNKFFGVGRIPSKKQILKFQKVEGLIWLIIGILIVILSSLML